MSCSVPDVDAGHDHVAEVGTEVFERGLDDLDRAAHLVDHVVGHDLAILAESGGARDAHHASMADGARVAELELELRRGRVE